MGLDELKQTVIKEAEDKAGKIIEDARHEEKAILQKAKERIEDYRRAEKDDAKKAVSMIEKRVKASPELEIKKLLLETKKQAIEKVFKNAQQKIGKITKDKRREHIEKLIERVGREVDVARIYCNKKDMGFISGIEAVESPIIGGLVAENSDGTIRVDYSYETLLENIKESNMQEIAKIIFK